MPYLRELRATEACKSDIKKKGGGVWVGGGETGVGGVEVPLGWQVRKGPLKIRDATNSRNLVKPILKKKADPLRSGRRDTDCEKFSDPFHPAVRQGVKPTAFKPREANQRPMTALLAKRGTRR